MFQDILAIFLLHYEPKRLRNWKRFWLETVGYRSVNLFTTALIIMRTIEIPCYIRVRERRNIMSWDHQKFLLYWGLFYQGWKWVLKKNLETSAASKHIGHMILPAHRHGHGTEMDMAQKHKHKQKTEFHKNLENLHPCYMSNLFIMRFHCIFSVIWVKLITQYIQMPVLKYNTIDY